MAQQRRFFQFLRSGLFRRAFVFLTFLLLTPLSLYAESPAPPAAPYVIRIFQIFENTFLGFPDFGSEKLTDQLVSLLQDASPVFVAKKTKSIADASGTIVATTVNGKIGIGSKFSGDNPPEPLETLEIDGEVQADFFSGDGHELSDVGFWNRKENELGWTPENKDDLYYQEGFIGIGTSTPGQSLEISGGNARIGGEIAFGAGGKIWSDLPDRIRTADDVSFSGTETRLEGDTVFLGDETPNMIDLQQNPLIESGYGAPLLSPQGLTFQSPDGDPIFFMTGAPGTRSVGIGTTDPLTVTNTTTESLLKIKGWGMRTPKVYLHAGSGSITGGYITPRLFAVRGDKPTDPPGLHGLHRLASGTLLYTLGGISRLWLHEDGRVVSSSPLFLGGGAFADSSTILQTTAAGADFGTNDLVNVGNIFSNNGQTLIGQSLPEAPGFFRSDDPDTGLHLAGNDTLSLVTGGQERVFVDGSGNVGLGTSAPGERLDISGDLLVTGSLAVSSVTGLSEPTDPLDAATKSYVDAVQQGFEAFALASGDPPQAGDDVCAGIGKVCGGVIGQQGTSKAQIFSCSFSANDYSGLVWCR